MSKRFVVTRKDGTLEDWGADSVRFESTHIVFIDNGLMTHAVHADLVREIEAQEEGE